MKERVATIAAAARASGEPTPRATGLGKMTASDAFGRLRLLAFIGATRLWAAESERICGLYRRASTRKGDPP